MMGKEVLLKFMKGAASAIPKSVNGWECVFEPENIKFENAIVLPFYFLDAHVQMAVHVTALQREINAAADPFEFGVERATRAMTAAMDTGFFENQPNYIAGGKTLKVSGLRLKDLKEAA